VKTTPQGSSSHVFKDSSLWESLTKDYKVHNGIHNNFHILFLQRFLFTYFYKSWSNWQHKVIECKLFPKAPISTPYILEGKNGWIINHIHLHLLAMYQTNHQVPLIIFHLPMYRFYTIGNLGFDQVYILDLPLLLRSKWQYIFNII
jgi:hypothetical protein